MTFFAALRGIIPALAGNTAPWSADQCSTPDHPRSRGEYYMSALRAVGGSGSSPLSRGIRRRGVCRCPMTGIIPALAGNTHRRPPGARRRRDHPRSRGEYIPWIMPPFFPGGSSPLSRGILRRIPLPTCDGRIIPALAGNTTPRPPTSTTSLDHPRSRGEYEGL